MKLKPKKNSGLPKFELPDFVEELIFPDDVTAVDSANVSRLISRYTQMLVYASQERTNAEIDLLKARGNLDKRKVDILTQNHAARNSQKWRQELLLSNDQGYAVLEQHIRMLDARRIHADMLVQNFDRYIWALSRELSRKTASKDGLAYEYRKPVQR